MNDTPRPENTSAEQTRKALIVAALDLFGRQGYDATATRQIAGQAKANIGSIAYHFGGKAGLRIAVADHIVATIQAVAQPALAGVNADSAGPDAAARQLEAVLDRMTRFVVAMPEAGAVVAFLLRELTHPTAALDRIYIGVFEPIHKRLCALWSQATGEPAESETTRIMVFTLIGQVVYFRIGREAVLRRMGWTAIGPDEASAIAAVAKANLATLLSARRKAR